jgi:hypothetical protein
MLPLPPLNATIIVSERVRSGDARGRISRARRGDVAEPAIHIRDGDPVAAAAVWIEPGEFVAARWTRKSWIASTFAAASACAAARSACSWMM